MNKLAIFPFNTGVLALALSLTLFTAKSSAAPKPAQPKTPAAPKHAGGPKGGGAPRSGEAARGAAAPGAAAARAAVHAATAAKHTAAKQTAPQIITVHTDFELQAGEDVLLRTAAPPLKYSDKGVIQNYTLAELKKLKGDHPELPGFPSETAKMKNGQLVLVYFGKKGQTSSYGDKPSASASSPEAGDDKPAKAGEPKAGEAGDAKAAKAGEPKASEAGDAKAAKAGEPKAGEAGDAKAAKVGEPKAGEAGDAKAAKTGEPKAGEAKPADPDVPAQTSATQTTRKRPIPPAAGMLVGVLSRYDEPMKRFVLRVDTQHEAGKVPAINSKEMLKDLEITLIVIVKD